MVDPLEADSISIFMILLASARLSSFTSVMLDLNLFAKKTTFAAALA
jgi:hypothetical protein